MAGTIQAMHLAAVPAAAPLDLGRPRAAFDRTVALLAESLATGAETASDVDRRHGDDGTAP